MDLARLQSDVSLHCLAHSFVRGDTTTVIDFMIFLPFIRLV
jgi:hypothetical protein